MLVVGVTSRSGEGVEPKSLEISNYKLLDVKFHSVWIISICTVEIRLGLALKSQLPMLDLCFLACLARELARANSLTKRAKIVAWLVINLTEPSQATSELSQLMSFYLTVQP
jgi:hypothetical protein